MRYLSLIFFIFLSLHSYFVFAQAQSSPFCPSVATAGCTNSQYLSQSLSECAGFNKSIGVIGMPAGSSYPAPTCGSTFNIVYSCASDCSCSDGKSLIDGSCQCPSGSTWSQYSSGGGTCVPDECPAGQIPNTLVTANGNVTTCIDAPDGETPPENCPSGYPPVNGQCPVCPSGNNPDGTCIDPTQCGEGQTNQGTVNGVAVCANTCSDPNQSWGFVNGVEGCYGSPSCPNGGSYGTVNGVSGCYGANSSSGSNNSSGSGTSTGSGGSGGSSGSGTSTGSGGGDNGGGSNGGGGGGSNNDIGSSYGGAESCPSGFVKSGDKCVSEDRGDCMGGYHELVVSRDPFLFICVEDDPPQSSSSSSSSTPSSSSQSSSSNSANSASASSGAGQCDPTANNYLACISQSASGSGSGSSSGSGSGGVGGGAGGGSIDGIDLDNYALDISQRLQQSRDAYTSRLAQIKDDFYGKVSVNLGSGSGSLPSKTVDLYGQSVELGLFARADFFDSIRWLFLAVASVLSAYIILSNR